MPDKSEFTRHGFTVYRQLFSQAELADIKQVIADFHAAWLKHNQTFYQRGAINSAYLTSTEYLSEAQRVTLFKFIASHKIMQRVSGLLTNSPCFMNTQLFFDPLNLQQHNYWHRDPQYHLSLEEQKQALQGPQVLHFRLALYDEPGIELVPGTQTRWDTHEELQVRMQQNGFKNYHNISSGLAVPLQAGDLLVFSANMIHRGLYGQGRMALDMLFCDPDPLITQFIRADCLPNPAILPTLEAPDAFANSLAMLQ